MLLYTILQSYPDLFFGQEGLSSSWLFAIVEPATADTELLHLWIHVNSGGASLTIHTKFTKKRVIHVIRSHHSGTPLSKWVLFQNTSILLFHVFDPNSLPVRIYKVSELSQFETRVKTYNMVPDYNKCSQNKYVYYRYSTGNEWYDTT